MLWALCPQVDAVLEIERCAARALTERFAGEPLDWQADGILVDFLDGRIHGFLYSSDVSERARRRWQAQIDAALRRAGL
jgi:hypothetical protein